MAGFARANLAVPDSEPLRHARTKRLDEHVGGRTQPQQLIAVAFLLEIEDDALLAAVQIAEEHRRRPVGEPDLAARIAVGRLDLDDLGAVIGEGEREIRARQEYRKIDDAQTRRASSALRLARARRRAARRCPRRAAAPASARRARRSP